MVSGTRITFPSHKYVLALTLSVNVVTEERLGPSDTAIARCAAITTETEISGSTFVAPTSHHTGFTWALSTSSLKRQNVAGTRRFCADRITLTLRGTVVQLGRDRKLEFLALLGSSVGFTGVFVVRLTFQFVESVLPQIAVATTEDVEFVDDRHEHDGVDEKKKLKVDLHFILHVLQ